jgi:nucleotide-binding universal stress UspA family protein
MFRSIMIPLDGSSLSEQALAVAADLVRASADQLILVHVHSPSSDTPIIMEGMPVIDDQLRSLAADHERAYLELHADRLRADGLTVDVRRLEGPTAASLTGYARGNAVDLIVLTTHGRSGFAHFWLGSIAENLLRISATPLLLLRPNPDAPEPQPLSIRRILTALDGSANAEAILAPVEALADRTGATVVLLQVVPLSQARAAVTSDASNVVDPPELAQQNGDAYLATIAARLLERGLQSERMVVSSSNPARTILDVAESQSIDLIALATVGRGGRAGTFLGSVADKVLRGATCPLLVLRPNLE